MFKSTLNKGFHMTFSNGLTISVQWGSSNYCEAQSYSVVFEYSLSQKIWGSETAEIAIWDNSKYVTNKFIDCHGDDGIGHLTADQVAEIIAKVSNWRVGQ